MTRAQHDREVDLFIGILCAAIIIFFWFPEIFHAVKGAM